jgi:hypothetical protein
MSVWVYVCMHACMRGFKCVYACMYMWLANACTLRHAEVCVYILLYVWTGMEHANDAHVCTSMCVCVACMHAYLCVAGLLEWHMHHPNLIKIDSICC